jgi:hypothetical protein
MVAGGWLELDYAVKTNAIQERCNKAHCHGPESIISPFFQPCLPNGIPQMLQNFDKKKWNSLPVLERHI